MEYDSLPNKRPGHAAEVVDTAAGTWRPGGSCPWDSAARAANFSRTTNSARLPCRRAADRRHQRKIGYAASCSTAHGGGPAGPTSHQRPCMRL